MPPLKSSRRTSSSRLFIPRQALLAIYDNDAFHPRRRVSGCSARASPTPQVIGVAVVAAWTAAIMGSFFATVHFLGLLRVTERQEQMGLDLSYHGGTAYEPHVSDGASASDGPSGLGRHAIGPRIGSGDVGGVRGHCASHLDLPCCYCAHTTEEVKVDPDPLRDDAAPSTPPA